MKKSILVIDDSPFISKQVRELVENTEYEVVGHAKSGEEGINLYRDLKPELVMMDIIMPGIDGIETASVLLNEYPTAKILMVSSLCDYETKEEVKKIGLKYLLPKPIDPELLFASLELVYQSK